MITLPVIIENVTTRKDNTIKLTIATNENTPMVMAQVFALLNRYAFVAIKEESFTVDEKQLIESLKVDGTIGKTPSQRLRSVLFVLWKDTPEGFDSFERFYEHKMDRMIDKIKGLLPSN